MARELLHHQRAPARLTYMANISRRNRKRERERAEAAENRRELIAAGLRRRDLLKMGLLTAAGTLVPVKGLSARPRTRSGFALPGEEPQSPPVTPFVEEMPRLPVLAPVPKLTPAPTAAPNRAAGEARTIAHQAFAQFPPQRFYELTQRAALVRMAPPGELPPQSIWGFNGVAPGPLIVERYGRHGSPHKGSIIVRQRNELPFANGGFGLPSVTTHLHNGHTPPESDGFPCAFVERGQFYDHHYPNVYAGVNSTHRGAGDVREALSTLWYHDHRMDHAAENTYKGLVGGYMLFNEFDTGDETTGFRLPSFGDGQDPRTSFDVFIAFADKLFDERTGLLKFDLFNTDGVLGDKLLVNGKIQPVFHVSPRRYRFRWLNTGPSRFYQMFLLGPGDETRSFWQISTDGNLLERPVKVTSARFSPGERVDVVVDFTNQAGKTFYLENRMEQDDGRGPIGNVLRAAGQGQKVLKIVVDGPVVADQSLDPARIRRFYGLPEPAAAPRLTRTFTFEKGNGQWLVNRRLVGDCEDAGDVRFAVKRDTAERWVLQNLPPGWHHPIHPHLEEFQTRSINGQAPQASGVVERGRKDIMRLEDNMEAIIDIRFRDFTGRFPVHCHNILHEDHGMMLLAEINEVGDDKAKP